MDILRKLRMGSPSKTITFCLLLSAVSLISAFVAMTLLSESESNAGVKTDSKGPNAALVDVDTHSNYDPRNVHVPGTSDAGNVSNMTLDPQLGNQANEVSDLRTFSPAELDVGSPVTQSDFLSVIETLDKELVSDADAGNLSSAVDAVSAMRNLLIAAEPSSGLASENSPSDDPFVSALQMEHAELIKSFEDAPKSSIQARTALMRFRSSVHDLHSQREEALEKSFARHTSSTSGSR